MRLFDTGRVDQVAFVEHDEIGAGDLVLKDLFDRIVVRQRGIGDPLPRQRVEIVGDAARGQRGAVDHDDDAVDGHAALDRRPVERLHQRLRQRETGSLDDDVLDAVARQNGIERRHEFVGHRAAEATVGELDDVLLRAGGIAAAFEDLAVDADIAELVDDDGKTAALRVGQHVADERRLTGAEKAGDDGAGHARERTVHTSTSLKSMGGMRAISPRLSGAGRPRHGRMPSAARASIRAPSISAAAQLTSNPPNT